MAAAIDDRLELLPLWPEETEEAILARMRDDAHEGLDPGVDVDVWADTGEPGHWFAAVMPCVKEFARLYDLAGSEVLAAGSPLWAWGEYLDDHGEVQTIVRLAAVAATGAAKFSGAPGAPVPPGTTIGVLPVTPGDDAPEFTVDVGGVIGGGGTVVLAITATEAGAAGNVSANAITEMITPLPGITVTNDAATLSGEEVENDEAFRERVLGAYEPRGAGNQADLKRWSRAWAGVGRVTVIPTWNGPNTAKVVITDLNGNPVAPAVVAGLQADLDPAPAGKGAGTAPIGQTVTVTTGVARGIEVVAVVEPEPGYTLDGTDGSVAIRQDIEDALSAYIESVEPGGEVVYAKIAGTIATVEGVHDVAGVTVEAGVINVAIDDDPAEVPFLTTPAGLT